MFSGNCFKSKSSEFIELYFFLDYIIKFKNEDKLFYLFNMVSQCLIRKLGVYKYLILFRNIRKYLLDDFNVFKLFKVKVENYFYL